MTSSSPLLKYPEQDPGANLSNLKFPGITTKKASLYTSKKKTSRWISLHQWTKLNSGRCWERFCYELFEWRVILPHDRNPTKSSTQKAQFQRFYDMKTTDISTGYAWSVMQPRWETHTYMYMNHKSTSIYCLYFMYIYTFKVILFGPFLFLTIPPSFEKTSPPRHKSITSSNPPKVVGRSGRWVVVVGFICHICNSVTPLKNGISVTWNEAIYGNKKSSHISTSSNFPVSIQPATRR